MKRSMAAPIALVSLFALAFAPAAPAQEFPSRRITIVVPFQAGGTTDTMMRLFGDKLSQRINQLVIVEPKPGAGSILGASAVLKEPPDGHTILFTGPQGYVPEFTKNIPFDFLKDFTAVSVIAQNPLGVTVNKQFGPRSMKDLIEKVKASPGKTNVGSSTPVMVVATQMFMKEAGLDSAIVNYKGATEAERAIQGNEVQWMLTNLSPYFRDSAPDSRARVVAIAGPKRHPDWPDVPTTAETGYPNFQLVANLSLHVHAKTPPAIVQRLNQEANAILQMPDIQQRYRQILGSSADPMSAAQAQQVVADLYKRWADAVKAVGFKPE